MSNNRTFIIQFFMFSQVNVRAKSHIQSIMYAIKFTKIVSNSKHRAGRKHRKHGKMKQ